MKIVQLTKNDWVIFMSAEEDYADKHFDQVVNKTEHLLEHYPNQVDVNFLKAKALMKLKRAAEAQQILIEFRDEMSQNSKRVAQMIQMSLENSCFMFARELNSMISSDYEAKILAAENQYRTVNSAKLIEQAKQFAHIGSLGVCNQVKGVEDARKLPLSEYLLAAKTVLSDPFLWQVTKTQVLLELVAVQVSDQVTLNWLDKQNYHIQLTRLKPVNQYASLTTVFQIIEARYTASDPIKLQLLEGELVTQSNYIYPFFDKVISDPQYWVKATIAQSFGDTIAANTESERAMLKWLATIHQAEGQMNMM
ncbi:hypothetical protein FC98_GL000693 [Lentilactobacillus kisonensis DSM 19906 = JCM 15041]|uniref:Uncharacterized protein n=1 Tax=Lentilactobacillus kisonensis DSM 19906 = JCM 15041 TaxID=1423766 RepID=A0A0R1NM24_9LACO|nr:hypothetical protein FC98_GL000693 [Lentilactobacillus kisonensis DSM 19906 = JCM 15041]